ANSRLTLATLAGHRVGLVAGHQYPELGAWLLTEKVSREDSVSESVNVQRVLRGWVDATVVGTHTLEYLSRSEPGLRDQLYTAEPAVYVFQRHFLVPAAYSQLLPALNRAIAGLAQDAKWQARLALYR
ncbi:MAG: transporter substrate-binding domain-containing protein, partial [Pseudomonas sp.]